MADDLTTTDTGAGAALFFGLMLPRSRASQQLA